MNYEAARPRHRRTVALSRTQSDRKRSGARRSQNKLRAARFAGCSPLPKRSNPVKPSQTGSNRIKPNQTCADWSGVADPGKGLGLGLGKKEVGGGMRASPTQSNPVQLSPTRGGGLSSYSGKVHLYDGDYDYEQD